MEPQITATATNARKKKYVIGEMIAPGLLMDNSHNACMIIPIENRTSKRRATTTEKGGQYVRDIRSGNVFFSSIITFYMCPVTGHNRQFRKM
jgi:hypothetical protein